MSNSRLLFSSISLASLLSVVACGGGGGGQTGEVTIVTPSTTVVCPDGSVAETLQVCPSPTLASISPENGQMNVSPDTLMVEGIVVMSKSALALPNINNDLALKAGNTVVPVTVDVPVVNGKFEPRMLKITPKTKLLYGQLYTYVFLLKDGVGKQLRVEGSFTTKSS